MKIFNYENNKKVVYIQLGDLTKLLSGDISLPPSIAEIISLGFSAINNSKRFEFLRFEDEAAVNFFEEQDWIVDYKRARFMSEKQLREYVYVTNELIVEINSRFELFTEYQKLCNQNLILRYERLVYKKKSIEDIISFKQGDLKLKLPIVADSDSMSLTSDNSYYIMNVSLDFQRMIISKKDGSAFQDGEVIPIDFYNMCLDNLIRYNQENNEFFYEFDKIDELTENKKNFVTTLVITTPKFDHKVLTHEDIQEQNESEKKGVLSLIKRIIKKGR